MDFTAKQLEQLLAVLKRGKWELSGEEIVSVNNCIAHVVSVLKFKKEQEIEKAILPKELGSPVKKAKK